MLAPAGVEVLFDDVLDAIHILTEGRELVIIVEFVSPSNKSDDTTLAIYRERRWAYLRRHVNVLEIDLTRSVKRLFSHALTGQFAYHVAGHLPADSSRVIGYALDDALSRIALPLRGEVLPVDLHALYQDAYQVARIAAQIDAAGDYAESRLPFPSQLTDAQRAEALASVQRWQEALARLK